MRRAERSTAMPEMQVRTTDVANAKPHEYGIRSRIENEMLSEFKGCLPPKANGNLSFHSGFPINHGWRVLSEISRGGPTSTASTDASKLSLISRLRTS